MTLLSLSTTVYNTEITARYIREGRSITLTKVDRNGGGNECNRLNEQEECKQEREERES